MFGRIRNLIVVGLAVGFMAVYFRNADLVSVWSEIRGAKFGFVTAALGAIVLSHAMRVERWQRLLAPLGRVGFVEAGRATVIGFATTAIFPGRLGEILRPYLLARRERFSASATLATVILERLLDLVTVLLMLGFFLLFFSGDLRQGDQGVLTALKVGGLVVAVGTGLILAMITVGVHTPDRLAWFALKIQWLLPIRTRVSVGHFIARFSSGFGIVGQPDRFIRACALSLPLWLCFCVSTWCVCQAFGISLPPGGALLLLVLTVLGVSVPTPAGIGGFHAAFQIGVTGFYGAPVDAAVGAGLVLHALSFGPLTLLGLVWMAHDGLTFRNAREMASLGDRDNSEVTEPVDVLMSEERTLTPVAFEEEESASGQGGRK